MVKLKKVVIIGGGFAGAEIAKNLEKRFEVILIDTKDYFEFIPSILRIIAEPKVIKDIQIKHKDYLRNTSIITNKVINVKKDSLILNNKKEINFDYLVIASGSDYKLPIKHNRSISAYSGKILKDYSHKVIGKDVLIVGAGLVGVELAAELADISKVSLIEGNNIILARSNKKTRTYAENYLKKKKINLILGEMVVESDGHSLMTNKSTKIAPDFVFLCTGITPNSEFMKKNFSDNLGVRGHIIVNKYLQLNNYNNIFAAGDVTDIIEEKTAQSAEKQAKVVAKNIILLERYKNNNKLLSYASKKRPMAISLGKYDGIIAYKEFTLTGFISSIIKYIIQLKTILKLKL
ncbi:MAG: NAD(P)/FAD-dependent oxidoreductase [Candidatus Woesearchaeota archaeon]